MRFFHISFLFFFLFVSCGKPLFNLSKEKHFLEKKIENLYFSNSDLDYVYKAKIDLLNNSLGGIFIVKKIKEEHYRLVFTTEFGAKLFDFEFIGESFKVNFIQKKLDKKMVVNLLRKDFKLLLTQNVFTAQSFLSAEHEVFLSRSSKDFKYYYYTGKNPVLYKISSGNKRREQVIILFTDIRNDLAKRIIIKHNNFKLNIELSFLH